MHGVDARTLRERRNVDRRADATLDGNADIGLSLSPRMRKRISELHCGISVHGDGGIYE